MFALEITRVVTVFKNGHKYTRFCFKKMSRVSRLWFIKQSELSNGLRCVNPTYVYGVYVGECLGLYHIFLFSNIVTTLVRWMPHTVYTPFSLMLLSISAHPFFCYPATRRMKGERIQEDIATYLCKWTMSTFICSQSWFMFVSISEDEMTNRLSEFWSNIKFLWGLDCWQCVAVMRQQLYYAAINVMSTQYQLSLLHAITREIDSSGQHELLYS